MPSGLNRSQKVCGATVFYDCCDTGWRSFSASLRQVVRGAAAAASLPRCAPNAFWKDVAPPLDRTAFLVRLDGCATVNARVHILLRCQRVGATTEHKRKSCSAFVRPCRCREEIAPANLLRGYRVPPCVFAMIPFYFIPVSIPLLPALRLASFVKSGRQTGHPFAK